MALSLSAMAGCRPTPTPRPGMTDYRVASISFEGVEGVDELLLEESLATQRNRFNPFAPISYYNRFELAADIERIETFYADHGYFDARVVDYDVQLEDGGRRNRARVHFVVEEGYQSSLAEDARFDTASLRSIERAGELFSDTPLRAGTPFDRALIEAERERIRRALMERSYARARVEARVYVDRESYTARVYFFFDPGIACVFGEVEVVGNRNIPSDLVRRHIEIRPDESYRHSLLRLSQVELYDLDAFTSVEVEALIQRGSAGLEQHRFAVLDEEMHARGLDLAMHVADPVAGGPSHASLLDDIDRIEAVDPRVPIRITVVESPTASYKFGGGIAIESSRSEAYGRANATWRNVLAPLNRAEVEGRLGYAWLPSVFRRNPLADGVIGEVGASLSRPRVIFGIFDASLRVGFVHGIETDHAFSRPSVRVSAENRIGEFTRFELGYQFEINLTKDFAERDAATVASARSSCDTLPRAFRLGYFDSSIRSERRNPNFEHGGSDWAGSFGVQLGEAALGDYPWARFDPEIRYYQRVTRRVSIATRASAGVIVDFGEPVPRSQCLFLGGGNTVRGFADRRLGPHFEPDIPNGGVASYLLNIEPRFAISKVFGLVAFLDLGQVNSSLAFDPSWGGDTGIGAAAGGGIRIFTPIGPIRADVGARLTPTPPDHGRIRTWNFVVSLGEAF